MLTLPYTFQYYFYSLPADMRKSFNGLHFLILDRFEIKDLPGKMFVFINKRKNSVKVFYWDNDGFAIWYKKLELGKFQFPKSEEKYLVISHEIISQIFLGFDIKCSKKLVRFSS